MTPVIQSFLVIVREGFEAILIVGAVVALLIKTGNRDRLKPIWAGVGLALAASLVLGLAFSATLAASPAAAEITEGVTMLLAAAVMFFVSYWLISKTESAKWRRFIQSQVSRAMQQGGGGALALVAFLAVFREGAETVLFYQAMYLNAPSAAAELVAGFVAGVAVLAVIFALFYKFGVKIPLRPFFAVTSVLLYYMAFVFAGKGIHELQEGHVLPETALAISKIKFLGIYPTVETITAQAILLLLFAIAIVKTFAFNRTASEPTAV
ncbi:MAG: FTR1 family iron permease [Gemmatimonadaceae bacterium]|nr:FTR1 family iron permease [Gemmatimonadaceae bacterium]